MESVKEISQKERFVISRGTEAVSLKGFHYESWVVLEKQLSVENLAKACLFSDLSLGAWKGHWLVHELSRQLNIDVYSKVQPLIGIESEDQRYEDTINRLIDNESTGDQNFLIAYESCKKIIPALVKRNIEWILIIPPAQEHFWEQENLQFIQLLSAGLENTPCKIALLNYEGASIPRNWNVAFDFPKGIQPVSRKSFPIPGVVDGRLALALEGLIPSSSLYLPGNHVVIAPSERGKEKANPAFFINILKNEENFSHLRTCFEIQGLKNISDTDFLQWEAAKRFSEGGYGVALRILEAVRLKTVDRLKMASVVSQIQNIRIALMYFSEAASEEIPSEDLPNEYKATLYQSKAWGLVMTNRAKEAEPFFDLARKYFSEEIYPRAYLYLLNIAALNKLRMGNLEAAFALEKEIENKLAQQNNTDWHILYINSINQARLNKKIKNYESAQAYYLKAFHINSSLKTESDLLYFNLCFAQLEELRGNDQMAFIYWLRVCVHWLSNEVPEALAPRVAQAVLRKGLTSERGHAEEISKRLKEDLQAIAVKNSFVVRNIDEKENLCFSRIERAFESPEIAVGTAGMGFIASSKEQKSVFSGKEYNALKTLVYQVLCGLLPELKQYKTIFTDTHFGNELPVSSQELVSSCIRNRISKVVFGESRYFFSENEQLNLLMSSKMKICDAVAFVGRREDLFIIHYKRYKKPVVLSEMEKSILEKTTGNSKVADIYETFGRDDSILDVLRKMEEKRLITIFL
ncbi:MAG: hypothetical protein MI784_12770 [Cytophagales bacterium]|nr:hypothetical protein [Cytophagales bacterium]